MNKHMLSIGLLLSVPATPVFANSHALQESSSLDCSVTAYRNFNLKTYLTVFNDEKWEIINHNGFELINYEYIGSQKMYSAGTQEWVFRASAPGHYYIELKRNDEIKTVFVRVVHHWCGTPRIATGDNPVTIIF